MGFSYPELKLPPKPDIFIEGITPMITMDVLVWYISPVGWTYAFIVMVFYSASTY